MLYHENVDPASGSPSKSGMKKVLTSNAVAFNSHIVNRTEFIKAML